MKEKKLINKKVKPKNKDKKVRPKDKDKNAKKSNHVKKNIYGG
jgi:hypothetical protein